MFPLFTIRNRSGQYLATYRAKNAKLAIARFLSEMNRDCNAFRKSGTRLKITAEDLTATIEEGK